MSLLEAGMPYRPDFSSEIEYSWWTDHCPCLPEYITNEEYNETAGSKIFVNTAHRFLADAVAKPSTPMWKPIVVCVTLVIMLMFMITDYIGPDWVMVSGVVLFMTCGIISIKEGIAGFSSAGILTVMALFVVAEGVSRTGALDHYMGYVLGRPKTLAGAQIRITIPIAMLSAFLNNTPIVAVMIPVTLRWARKIGVPKEQLLIPLSYATILGGTCTLVGTSTNLIVSAALKLDYPDIRIGLFEVGTYGVPNAMIGIAYMLLVAQFLLPNGKNVTEGMEQEDALLGARVTPFSPSSGRTVKRSGLTDTAGVYLVYVRRATTGNIHHTVSDDFVLSVGDELYFTGNLEDFGLFCTKNALDIITTDKATDGAGAYVGADTLSQQDFCARIAKGSKLVGASANEMNVGTREDFELSVGDELYFRGNLPEFMLFCNINGLEATSTNEVGTTKESLLETDEGSRLRLVNKISDYIQGRLSYVSVSPATKIIVAHDSFKTVNALLVAIDTHDRSGLLMEISKTLFEQGLQQRHSEAKVAGDRSLSVWRCECTGTTFPDVEEVWTAISTLLHVEIVNASTAAAFRKAAAVSILRAKITAKSSLIGKTAIDSVFREVYKAGIVAYQKRGKNVQGDAPFEANDILVLEISEGSSLLQKPPAGFYNQRQNSAADSDQDIESDANTKSWLDLQVEFGDDNATGAPTGTVKGPKGEFITAFTVPEDSPLVGKSLNQLGYAKLPGVQLVSIERPMEDKKEKVGATNAPTPTFNSMSIDDPLQEGDVFWYAGSAEAIGDLRKLQGLVFYQQDEMIKATPLLQDRRLVQAVIARNSPLVGKTVTEVRFREVYGGAVVSIQRGANRVHQHPGEVKIQTGDVLLLDAPPSFAKTHVENYRTFALISEVSNSSPPRPALFALCVVLIAAALACESLKIQDLLVSASIVGIFMVATGIVTQQEARDCLQWDLFVVVSCAFGVSSAMKNSGVADAIASFLVNVGKGLGIGNPGLYGAIYLAANLLSAVLTNNAAAQLTFPIAMAAVDKVAGSDRKIMCLVIMLASSDYITSFGYQTNLMVYGPGEYSNIDYLKFGGPMQILLWLSTVAMLAIPDQWYISWIFCSIVLLVVMFYRLATTACSGRNGRKSQTPYLPSHSLLVSPEQLETKEKASQYSM